MIDTTVTKLNTTKSSFLKSLISKGENVTSASVLYVMLNITHVVNATKGCLRQSTGIDEAAIMTIMTTGINQAEC